MKAYFDEYAQQYKTLHENAISASGEGAEYFHDYKVACLKRLGISVGDKVLDYGCGIGNLVQRLSESCAVSGYDPSSKSLEVCHFQAPSARLFSRPEDIPVNEFDVAILSCVLHHVDPVHRNRVLMNVFGALKPGGRVAIFEHNPWNPLTVRVVKLCPFDEGVVLLPANELRTRCAEVGFISVRTEYIVFFPKFLSWFRSLEPLLSSCPFGAQTMTTGIKPLVDHSSRIDI